MIMTEQQKPDTEQPNESQQEQPNGELVEVAQEKAVTEEDNAPKDKSLDYPNWLSTFQSWLGRGSQDEVKNLSEFFDRSKQWWAAAGELTSEEFSQASTYLKRDLMMFYRHYQQDLDESEFVQSVKESLWRELAEMTDKSQLEWQELKKDFDHDGVYHAGEWIGMGTIVCCACHYKMEFNHPEELTSCPQCGGEAFLREALAP